MSGELLVIISTFAFGSMGVLAKGLYNSGVNVPTALTLRFLFASIVLLIYMIYKKIDFKLNKEEFIVCALLGLGGYSLFSYFYFKAIEYAGASMAALVFAIFPVYIIIIYKVFFNRNIGKAKVFFLLLSLLALYLLTSISKNVSLAGVLFALGGAFFYALYTILIDNEKVKQINPIKVSFYIIFFTSIANLILWVPRGQVIFDLSLVNYIRLIALGVFSTAIAILTYYLGIQKIGAVKASIISNLEALIAALLAMFFLGEILTFRQLIGAILMIAAVIGVSKE